MWMKYFGDSYDIVKKSLLDWLSAFGPWAAHPMFTHRTSPQGAAAFSRFLGVPLVTADVLTPLCDRGCYFASCHSCHSVFLDPDTGVRLRVTRRRDAPHYIFARELIDLVKVRPQALTLTFDQSLARGRERGQIRVKLAHFAAHGIHAFAYVSHASFIVLGQSGVLVRRAHEQILAASGLPTRCIVTRTSYRRRDILGGPWR